MATPRLAPSLRILFAEIDRKWPHRDRRTDGWYADPRVRISYGHNPDPNGWVHAIDVDKDGISPTWIIDHLYRGGGVLWYVIWSRGIWSMDYGFTRRVYNGSNPHTDHMHIEIRHTAGARNYSGSWRIAPAGQGSFGSAAEGTEWGAADFYPEVASMGEFIRAAGGHATNYGRGIASLRR